VSFTRADDRVTQPGVAGNVVNEIPGSFMTRNPDDAIRTRTPHGVVNANKGAEVVTEIESIARPVGAMGAPPFGRAQDAYRAGDP
jgi:hypothetical protein